MPPTPDESAKALADSFVAPHLKQAQQDAERALRSDQSPPPPGDDPRDQEEYTFAFDWTDARGRRWTGTFTNKIVTLYQRRLIGLTRARVLGGLPIESVDVATQTLIHMSVWLQTSLTARPNWFADPDTLNDDALVAAVFEEVAAHEATFHRHPTPQAPGQAAR